MRTMTEQTRQLLTNREVIALFNRSDRPADIATSVSATGLRNAGNYQVRDVWAHDTTTTGGPPSRTVPPHGKVLLRVTPS